jgi:hypothetical protein
MNRLLRLLSALVAGVMATAGLQDKTPTLYLFSPDGTKTRRQLRSDELNRRAIRLGVKK